MNLSNKLNQLTKELLEENHIWYKGKYLTPINSESELANLRSKEERKVQFRKEIYNSLIEVVESIEEGGISKEIFDKHMYAINIISRNLLNLNMASGSPEKYDKCDNIGELVSPRQARLEDGNYGAMVNDRKYNIKGVESDWEGTLYQRDYDAEGHLETYRFFHQSHRDSLKVKTVNLNELYKKIRDFVNNFDDAINISVDFSLSKEEYQSRLDDFSEIFGEHVSIEGSNELRFEFKDNPKSVVQYITQIANQSGLKWRSFFDARFPYIINENDQYANFEPSERYAPIDAEVTPDYAIIPVDVEKKFALEIMKMYVESKMGL